MEWIPRIAITLGVIAFFSFIFVKLNKIPKIDAPEKQLEILPLHEERNVEEFAMQHQNELHVA